MVQLGNDVEFVKKFVSNKTVKFTKEGLDIMYPLLKNDVKIIITCNSIAKKPIPTLVIEIDPLYSGSEVSLCIDQTGVCQAYGVTYNKKLFVKNLLFNEAKFSLEKEDDV